jgi:hypothetical protein
MALKDTVKQQAGQAWGKAQQGIGQGQAKYDQLQAKRQAQSLLRNLGAAYYAQQREGGSAEAVSSALVAMDQHVAAQQRKNAAGTEASSTNNADDTATNAGTSGTQIES